MRRLPTVDLRRPAKFLLVGAALVLLPAGRPIHVRPPAAASPVARRSAAPVDTFPHDRHKKFACLTCHFAQGGHGRLTFEPPRGCQICHHQDVARVECATCHEAGERDAPINVQLTIAITGASPRTRPVGFPHSKHTDLKCVRCHTTPVSLEPPDSVLTCRACHGDHHAPGRRCATCHRTAAITTAHQPPKFNHTGCDGCHTPARVAILIPARSFCLACHEEAQDHNGPKECTECHFLRSPDEFRPQLTRSGAR